MAAAAWWLVLAARTPAAHASDALPPPKRLVFSLTTTAPRIKFIKPVLDAVVAGQRRPPDAVYLAVPPGVQEPDWLRSYNATSKRPGVLRVLRMPRDYGPASKLLTVLRQGRERAASTVVVFGDDDIVYGDQITHLHYAAHAAARRPMAFGSRLIGIGEGEQREEILEATGTVSVRASALPAAAFGVVTQPDACRLSDDYWISHHLTGAGVGFATLPACTYDFNSGAWPPSCGTFAPLAHVAELGALSARTLAADGTAAKGGGDWRDQLRRYDVCSQHLRTTRGGQRAGARRRRQRRWSRGGRELGEEDGRDHELEGASAVAPAEARADLARIATRARENARATQQLLERWGIRGASGER